MQREGVSWGAGISKAAMTLTMGRAETRTGTTSVCPAELRSSHPPKSPQLYRKPSLALSTMPWKPIWSSALRLSPAEREKTLGRQGLAAGPSPMRQHSKGTTTMSQGRGLLVYRESWRQARLVLRRARWQAEAPDPAVVISQHKPGLYTYLTGSHTAFFP